MGSNVSGNTGAWIGTLTIPNTPSPIPWPFLVTTASAQVIAANNPSRRSLYFYNASPTNTIWICPALTATGTTLSATNGAGSMAVQALSGLPIVGSALQAWNAITTTGTAALTTLEFVGGSSP